MLDGIANDREGRIDENMVRMLEEKRQYLEFNGSVQRRNSGFLLRYREEYDEEIGRRPMPSIYLGTDEKVAQASGCSIDTSFQFIKDIESQFEVQLLDRMTVAYRDGTGICLKRIDVFENSIQEGDVNEQTIVFNNLVDNKGDFDKKWEVLLKDSWHRKLLD